MEETINNYDFDLAYEDYKAYYGDLVTVYHRLLWNFPNHESARFWKKRQEFWEKYELIKLGYAAFDSLAALEKEISKIHAEAINALDLAKALSRLAEHSKE